MKSHNTYVKVRYAETDQMGVVHHGNYADYLEIARLDWLDVLGVSYKSMEKEGIMLPVYELHFKFIKSALFDDELKIVTKLVKTPSVKIEFDYEIYNQEGELLTTANTVLVFMDSQTRKPIRCPEFIVDKLNN
ncbi:acyl-CoA thioester hydrolase [Gillisia mitskevichiae]|uniref:Acyl-CoA thioester hydrolase n=1 Tax=Gillisia mitskevichiae TaxID=270921 RepID=A0A495PLB4_9FLAO|nr:thioesterase family protein [Gillisia mitskevichiae]RKS50776.1 acyl-CoA thioester hydrolase [Gillisia mitskevichiae]